MAKTRARLYCNDPLAAGAMVALRDDQAHYLLHVLRYKQGDEILLFNAAVGEWAAALIVQKKQAIAAVTAQTRPPMSAPLRPIMLAPALIKRAPMDWLVEKASELGVVAIHPLITARTNADHVKTERLQTIAMEAAEQCDRLDVPLVLPPQNFGQYVAALPDYACVIVAAEHGTAQPIAAIAGQLNTINQPLYVLVGPEGGWTESELAILRARPHSHMVRLGPRLLRAETANIAVLAIIQALCGDWV